MNIFTHIVSKAKYPEAYFRKKFKPFNIRDERG
jgi:hypothetical protein